LKISIDEIASKRVVNPQLSTRFVSRYESKCYYQSQTDANTIIPAANPTPNPTPNPNNNPTAIPNRNPNLTESLTLS